MILPRCGGSDEELGAISILSGIGHAEKASLGVLQFKVLIRKFVAVNYQLSAPVQSSTTADTDLIFHRCHRPW